MGHGCTMGRLGEEEYLPLQPPRPRSADLLLHPVGTPGPTSDSGPFRVKIDEVDYILQRTRFLERDAGQDELNVGEGAHLSMQVVAEPRLMLKLVTFPKILEAVDDQGRSLLEQQAGFPDYLYGVPDPIILKTISLRPPKRPGGTLKRFRGTFPVLVTELKPDPIMVPIAGSQGQSFDGPEATLMIQSIRLDPAKDPSSITLVLRSKFENLDLPEHLPESANAWLPTWGAFLPYQFVVLDDKGQEIPHWRPEFERKGHREALVTLHPNPRFDEDDQPTAVPAKLLFYGLIRTTTEIPFEFRDIPLP
jgi:hypothetical protein